MTDLATLARKPLLDGGISIGIGIKLSRSVEIARGFRNAGYDFLFIDLEHGVMSLDAASQICLAALDAGIAPLVRVPKGEFSMATRLLDNGALGIVIPHVDTADEAREIVQKLKYAPLGTRSASGLPPHFDALSKDRRGIFEAANKATLVTVMLESPEAIANADAIAAVEGIDVLLVGTNDLVLEMQLDGHRDPCVTEAYDAVIDACRKHGKWAGTGGISDPQLLRQLVDRGCRFVHVGNDGGMLFAAARGVSDGLRKAP